MSDHFLSFRSSRFHYSLWGTGHRVLFAFHGYGESAASFGFLAAAIGQDFTIVAVDLPFHGQTEWNEGLFFAPADLLKLLQQIAAGLADRSADWWLLGYSMGGRVALELFGLAPGKVRRLVLLAPDGIRVNPWYWLATRPSWGNHLFRLTMQKPGWFFFLLRAANRFGLVNPSVYKFTVHYIDDTHARRLLYTRWSVMRGFRPDLRKIAALVRGHRTPVQLLYGRYDRIIQSRRGASFERRCAPYCKMTILPGGHQLLQPKFMEVVVSALYLPII
ncbi:MAG TPA: alpha/beta fold hydrolase [Puia sp.]|nr:alpha/beta fold hydrolase [Puia sp.]